MYKYNEGEHIGHKYICCLERTFISTCTDLEHTVLGDIA